MKKRALSWILSLMMCFSLLPAMTLTAAASGTYDLWVGGVQVTDANLSGEGWSFEPGTSTLSLNGYSFEGTGYGEPVNMINGTYVITNGDKYGAIFSKLDELTISVNGANTVTETGGDYCSCGIFSTGSVIINGSGSLEVAAGYSTKNKANEPSSCGILAGNLTIGTDGGSVSVKGDGAKKGISYGVRIIDRFTVNAGTVTLTGGNQASSFSYGGNCATAEINGGTVTFTGGNDVPSSYGGSIGTTTINGGTVTFLGGAGVNGSNATRSYGLWGSALNIYGGELTLQVSATSYNAEQRALYTVTPTFGLGVSVSGSYNIDGSEPMAFADGDAAKFKYIHSTYDPITLYDLYVAGTQVTSNTADDLSLIDGVEGTASYDPDSNTLTLKDAVITNRTSGTREFGIQYTGSGTFKIDASGTNTVSVSGSQTDSSAGIAVGSPGEWGISSKADLVINLAEEAVLTANGGAANGGYYPSSYGIINAFDGSVTVQGSGALNANGGVASYSYGLGSNGDLTIGGEVTVNAKGADNVYYSVGISANGALTVNGGTVTATGNTSALGEAPVLGEGIIAGGSVNIDGSGAVIYSAADNDSYKWFQTPYTPSYSVLVTPGKGMTKTADSGEEMQEGLTGAMNNVVYQADEAHYFPADYSVDSVNDIIVTRDSFTQITVSGTPSADAEINLKDTAEKVKPDVPELIVNQPEVVGGTGSIPTTSEHQISTDGINWTNCTGESTDLAPGTYYVRIAPSDTGLASDVQTIIIKEKIFQFDDVQDPSAWFYDVVYEAYNYQNVNGTHLMSGYANTNNFGPADDLNRASFAVMLHRLADEPEAAFDANAYGDVKNPEDFFATAVMWAKEAKVITGYENGNFGPSDKITRQQIATILYRYAKDYAKVDVEAASAKADLSQFPDSTAIADFAKDGMKWAIGAGIISGKEPTPGTKVLDPNGNALRAEVAAMFMRYIKYISASGQ